MKLRYSIAVFGFLVLFTILSVTPALVLAQGGAGGDITGSGGGGAGGDIGSPTGSTKDLSPLNPKFNNPLQADNFGELLNAIIKILITLGIPIAVIFIIYSGFLFVTARGNEEQIKKAKTTLLWTLVGIAVLLGASIIGAVLENTINSITKPPTP